MDHKNDWNQFWSERWQKNEIGFHHDDFNPTLIEYQKVINKHSLQEVLIPLAGKSLDMLWFIKDTQADVTAIELSQKAFQDFIAENNLEDFIVKRDNQITVIKFPSQQTLTLYNDDFFNFAQKNEFHQKFDLIYDRAALIALDPVTRTRLAPQLLKLLKPNAHLFLIGLCYQQDLISGPPFSVPTDEVQHLFKTADIEILADKEIDFINPRFNEKGVNQARQAVYLIRK